MRCTVCKDRRELDCPDCCGSGYVPCKGVCECCEQACERSRECLTCDGSGTVGCECEDAGEADCADDEGYREAC